jgi:hypothetical protein
LYGGGLKYTENSGSSFTAVSKVTYCGAVGIGKAATGAAYETIYIYGTVNGVLGIHRSTDKGLNWVRVNDNDHEYGGPANGQFVVGDMNVYGRVYMSTAGRGVVFGSPQTCTPTAITPYTQVNGGAWTQTANAALAAGGTVKFGPQPSAATIWNWRGPNDFASTGRELTLTNVQAANAGTYTATYTNTSGCRSSYQFTVAISGARLASSSSTSSAAIADMPAATTLIAYPNPVRNKVSINVPQEFIGGKLMMTSSSGGMVYGGTVMQANSSIDMSMMPAGTYIINVRNRAKNISLKIVKK